MPPQVTNLRLLLTSTTHPYPYTPLFPLLLRTSYHSFSLSCYSRRPQNNNNLKNHNNNNLKNHSKNIKDHSDYLRRNKSSVVEMEEAKKGDFGFNKRRAEGRDKNDRPKNLQLKVRKLNPVNTCAYIQILGTGMDTQDTSPSVLLFFDKQRFIFNAGEGLQRFCTEHRIKLSKIDHIFLSRVCSETAGGLPGLLLTLAGMGDEGMSVNLWGPSDLKHLVVAIKSFIPNAAVVHTHSFGTAPNPNGLSGPRREKLIDDEVVKILAIIVQPDVLGDTERMEEDANDSVTGRTSPKRSGAATSKPGDLSVVYICELPEIKGKFDPKKASSLGLRPGPKYRELQLGNSVKSDRQDRMVHPSDVMGPSIPGPIVILVDCPTLHHLRELLSTDTLSDFYGDPSSNHERSLKTVNCVVHLGPASVTNQAEYQKFMSKFKEAQHVMAGHEMKNIEVPILKASARIAARLNHLCPQFFPAPGFWSLPDRKNLLDTKTTDVDSLSTSSNMLSAENLLKFHLRPLSLLGLDKSSIPTKKSALETIDDLRAEIPEITDASQKVAQLCRASKEASGLDIPGQGNQGMIEEPWLPESYLPNCLEDISREDMEIVLLGTGSSQPSKYRNVSSIFINLFSKGTVLFDCGEGSLGQLKRRFGVDGADEAVKNLRCIWISHIHADHHTGLARILALRRNLLKRVPHEPVIVVGPRQLKTFLDEYQKLEDLDMQFLDCRHTTKASLETFEVNENSVSSENSKVESIDSTLFAKGSRMENFWKKPSSPVDTRAVYRILKNLKKMLKEAGLESMTSFPVIHCPEAYGVALKAADRINSVGKTIPGWKIVYSGDTRPCPELVKASQGATVLIHEATFEDGMVEEAIARNHSTTQEAIDIGDSAGVYRVILTHFSQRYPKIPVFDETHMHKTCIAFDLMSINMADLPVLPRILPYVKLLFKDEMVVDEADDLEDASVAVEA
ncbi:hypothetical protein Leryth_018599 [Lithospermum erythrorhizon]|nr:hypothetical protein Leryth_018599 [Lithospermum erythrorhizon]